jgi:ketosteroid isomerase-like protein
MSAGQLTTVQVVRDSLAAYYARDAAAGAALLAENFVFTSPQDDHIDKTAYMERCFPTADRFISHEILAVNEIDDENVFLFYEYELATGERFRNSEVVTVRGSLIVETQVFFGGTV